jgi:RHS repeat-associated protein
LKYIYDAEGRRVAKLSGTTVTNEYLFDTEGNQQIELNGSGTVLHTNLYAGGKLIATYQGTNTYFHFTDWLGTRRYEANSAGAMTETCTNLPFGDSQVCTGTPDATEQHFTGKEHDSESGLDYFGARYYANVLGRWVSTDSAIITLDAFDPQTWNRYSYAFNKPVTLVDPNGNWPGWYHHIIIQDTFGNLGAHAVAILDAASDWVDSVAAGNQAPERAFMHAMRDGADNQTAEDAERESNDYVNSELDHAVQAQVQFEEGGGTGLSDTALTDFGHALHTVTDATSPEHAGFQPWYCLVCRAAYRHHRAEEDSASSGLQTDVHARFLAHIAAEELWKRYQQQLDAERKKRAKAKKKKDKEHHK